MALYIMISNLTDEGRKTIKKNPGRILEVDQEMSRWGILVLHQFAVLGEYDFVNLVEAPDNETVARASVEIGSRGSVSMVTMPAIPVDEFIASLK